MNSQAFMTELQKRLRHLPKADREDAIAYYKEYLEEMNAGEDTDVTKQLGKPADVAREIIAECTQKHMDNPEQKGNVKNSAVIVWLVILGIFAAPIALPLLVAFIIVIFALLLTVAAVILAVIVSGAAGIVAGIASFVASVIVSGIGQKLVCAGMGFICVSLGLLLMIGSIKLSGLMLRGIAHLFKGIFLGRKVKVNE